jgi:glutathione peroxidase
MGFIKNIITGLYNLRMKISRKTGIGMNIKSNDSMITPPQSFYSLQATANNGELISFEIFRNKKVLLVNLASECGYTPQYNELENLHQRYKNRVSVIGFPSNDFGGQEPGDDKEIEQFCRLNFGVTFPLFHKDHVSGANKQPVYQWLTDPGRNGWNNHEPSWNFCKYLVTEQGNLANIFSSAVSPTGEEITTKIK